MKDCKFIFMAGGFSESAVVKAAMDGIGAQKNIRIVRPMHASMSVMTGAVLFGATRSSVFSSRISSKTYGIGVSAPWDERKHKGREKMFYMNNKLAVPY